MHLRGWTQQIWAFPVWKMINGTFWEAGKRSYFYGTYLLLIPVIWRSQYVTYVTWRSCQRAEGMLVACQLGKTANDPVRDGTNLLDVFDEMLGQLAAMFVATETRQAKTRPFPSPNQVRFVPRAVLSPYENQNWALRALINESMNCFQNDEYYLFSTVAMFESNRTNPGEHNLI